MNTAILRRCLDQKEIGHQNLSGGRVGTVLKEKWQTTHGIKIIYTVVECGHRGSISEIPPRIDLIEPTASCCDFNPGG